MLKLKKKVGIIGGTFNPIHIGHLLLAETAKDNYALDEVVFIPSGCSYMKDAGEVADKRNRYEMTALAICNNSSFSISAIEVDREGATYTYETLLVLKKEHPDTEYFFIVGADSLFAMETWKFPEKIFSSCTILAAVREDKDKETLSRQTTYLHEKFNARIELLALEEIPISSTDIRTKIKQGKSVRYMIPDSVIAYIEKHRLY